MELSIPKSITPEILSAISGAEATPAKLKRVVDAIAAALTGDFSTIPSITAAPIVLAQYIRQNAHNGWVYEKDRSTGHLIPWLVTEVEYRPASRDMPARVSINTVANGSTAERRNERVLGVTSKSHSLEANRISRRTPAAVMQELNLIVATEEMNAAHETMLVKEYEPMMASGFAQQYTFSGRATIGWSDRVERTHQKVVHDVRPDEIAPTTPWTETHLTVDSDGDPEVIDAPLPTHPFINVFDLGSHDNYWVHASDLTEYTYDSSLSEKIALPEDQRNLLDVLTADLGEFTGDIIGGKTAGNVVLCKGRPGVGKTLTAEVYSELIERPLYSVHTGNLGSTPESVQKALGGIFKRAKRWDAVLLLDEADVFVMERGRDIAQNAIVAEFLRTMEYFDGLMFMTTNRSDMIDDAIMSRSAAIIDYRAPDDEGIRRVWEIQAAQHGVTLSEKFLDEVVAGFSHEDERNRIAPRDVKMLLRLILRISASKGVEPNMEIVQQCAMFRGLHLTTQKEA